MLSYEEINDYCKRYKIDNGIVIDKKTNQQVLDENIILKVKTSILIYKEAHNSYTSDLQQFGKTNRTQQEYISKTMEKFGVNGEQNTYGINKLVNRILSSNGYYEEMMSGDDLLNSKFSILLEPKKEYSLAYLKLKFREKGLDIEDLQISQDLTELQHNGVSKVIIKFKLKKYEKNNASEREKFPASFHHPKAEQLNELEQQKLEAKQNHDEVAYNYAQKNIERIIRETSTSITIEQFKLMSTEQQLSYIELKINEAKALHDKESYDYWNSNLISLQKQKNSTNMDKEEKKDYKYYYQELMKAVEKRRSMVNPSEEDKKKVVGEIFYNQGYLIKNLNTEEEIRTVLTAVVDDLSGNEQDMKLQNIIISDMQEKYEKVKKKNPSNVSTTSQPERKKSEQLAVVDRINQIRKKLNKISEEYEAMLSNGNIDDDELAILIGRINKLSDDAYYLKRYTSNQNEEIQLKLVIDMLESKGKKMLIIQNTANKIYEEIKKM